MYQLYQFFSGAIMSAAVVISLFFFRIWSRTRDRLFALFAVAFALLALERWPLAIMNVMDEERAYVYIIRLVAFVLIIAAVWDKNRKPSA